MNFNCQMFRVLEIWCWKVVSFGVIKQREKEGDILRMKFTCTVENKLIRE